MTEQRTRRRVTSRHCAFTKCWCASEFVYVCGIHQRGALKVQDDADLFWAVSEDLIETHTEDAPLTRYDVLAGVDTL